MTLKSGEKKCTFATLTIQDYPRPYGRIPFEQHLCYTGSSLLGTLVKHYLIKDLVKVDLIIWIKFNQRLQDSGKRKTIITEFMFMIILLIVPICQNPTNDNIGVSSAADSHHILHFGEVENRVNSSICFQFISPWILTQKFNFFAQSLTHKNPNQCKY